MKKHGSLNHIFRLVWSHVLKTWVAVAENTKGRGKTKNSSSKLVAAALAITAFGSGLPPALAGPAATAVVLPTGAQVSAGSVSVNQSDNTLTVTENSQRAAVNWQTFSIGKNDAVNFVQPNSAAVILNRVVGTEASLIAGALNANGQVFILNSNGLLFSKNASVNTGGLVASTLNLSDSDFMSGKNTFTGNGRRASVINQGSLSSDNGYVALLGNQVVNQGVITARLGTAILAAGDQISLNFNGSSLVNVVINKGTLDALVSNQQAIYADGGLVVLTAKAADTILASAVNNTGEIRAQTIANQSGKIYLLGDMQNGTVNVGGTLDASALNGGNGGAIETSAAKVVVGTDAKVTASAPAGLTGSWLIDPTDFTISAGSAAQTSSGIGATTLQGELGTISVSIQTAAGGSQNGDINVNAPVSWSANTLSLTAQGNININANMIASGTSHLTLNDGWNGSTVSPTYGAAGSSLNVGMNANGTFMGAVYFADNTAGANARSGTGFLTINGNGYTVIDSAGASGDQSASGHNTLQGMAYSGNLSGHYALGADISVSTDPSIWNFPTGFAPIGGSATPFSGTFEGLGHSVSTITSNTIYLSGHYIGMFGAIGSTGLVENLALTAAAGGLTYIGGLAGANAGTISNVLLTSTLSNDNNIGSIQYVGGLVGYNSGTVNNSHVVSTAGFDGTDIGGLAGYNSGTITGSSSSGVVGGSAGGYSGGLVGYNTGTISTSTSSATVGGPSDSMPWSGGLVGYNSGAITGSSASGSVTGSTDVGGLVGQSTSAVSSSSATGNVTGGDNTGGLIGITSAAVSSSFATGNVSGGNNTGGLVGSSSSTISASHASGSVSGSSYVGGLVGAGTTGITGSSATGNVTGTNYTGGLIGTSTGTIDTSTASGSVSGSNYTGGLAGATNSAVTNSAATGNVTSAGNDIGGLIGTTTASISGSHATGIVNGSSYVGGLVGLTTSSVLSSYHTGSVTGAGSDVGGLVGSGSTTISSSYAAGNVTANEDGGGNSNAGGLIGYNTGSIGASTASGTVTGPGNYVGGLVGSNIGATISASYTTGSGTVSGWDHIGGLAGGNTGVINNGAATGAVSGHNSLGGLVGSNSGTVSAGSASGSVSASGAYASDTGGLVGTNSGTINSASAATGAVTSTGSNVGGLVGNNTGTISGTNASGVVSGLYYVGGLVGYNNTSATLDGSHATGSSVSGATDVGGLVGISMTTAAISNSSASANVTGTGNYVGGLVGKTSGSVSSSSASGAVSGSSYVGGLIGNSSSAVSASSASGAVQGSSSNVGGLVGYIAGNIDASHATGATVSGVNYVGGLAGNTGASSAVTNSTAAVNVSSTGNDAGGLIGAALGPVSGSAASGNVISAGAYVGGLIGTSSATIDSSHATGATVSGSSFIGGLVGNVSAAVTNSSATDNVSATGDYAGGLVGATNSAISGSSAAGAVTGASYAGGLAGSARGAVTGSTATGAVSGASYVGGLVGYQTSSITGSSASGNVTGTGNEVGGLVGYNDGNGIASSFATGQVSGINFVGGLVGKNSNSVTGSYATGNVGGSSYVGGLVGYLYYRTEISNSYSAGNVVGTSEVGGLVGYNYYGTISNAFYNADQVTVNGGHELTAGAIFGTQYADWFGSNVNPSLKTLNIANYSSTLPLVGGKYQVSSLQGLKDMLGFSESDVSYSFLLTANLNLPQGFSVPYFNGNFDGGGNTLFNLSLSLPDSMRGMFGYLPNAATTISNIGVANGNVEGLSYLGGLVGFNYGAGTGAAISNSFFSGSVTGGNVSSGGYSYVGGLVGRNYGAISNSFAKGTVMVGSVAGSGYAGGLVGNNSGSGTISQSFAAVNVTTGSVGGYYNAVGGLVGGNFGSISQSYATGNVTATGSVTGGRYEGGLVGEVGGTITDSFSRGNVTASGSVSGSSYVGGLVGAVYGSIANSYATGSVQNSASVSGSTSIGALVGMQWSGSISNSFYDNQVNGSMTGIGGTADVAGQAWGMSTADMKNAANFGTAGTVANNGVGPTGVAGPNWDLNGATPIWVITPLVNAGYPCLAWTTCTPPTVVYLDVSSGTSIYGNTPSFTYGYFTTPVYGAGSAVTNAGAFGTAIWSGSVPTSTSSAGAYSVSYVDGISLSNNAYTLEAGNPFSWTIVARPVTFSGSMTYNGLTAISGALLTAGNLVNGDSVTVGGSGTLASANAGTENMSNLSGLTLSNTNYTVVGGSGDVTVGKAALSVTASNASKIYGQVPTLSAFTSSGLVNGETIGSVTETSSGSLATAGVTGSPYVVVASAATGGTFSAANYTIAYINGALTVTPATLTVTAGNATKTYGQIPTLSSFTSSGLVNGETIGSVTETSSGSAVTAGVTGSPYPIVPGAATGGSFNAANYSISYVDGNLSVTPLALAISAVSGATRPYDGTANAASSLLMATNLINGDTLTLSGNGKLAGSAAGSEALTGLSGLSFNNPNYTLNGAIPSGSILITAQAGSAVGNPDLTDVIANSLFRGQSFNYLPAALSDTTNPVGTTAAIPNIATQLGSTFGDLPLAIVSAPTDSELTQVVPLSQARVLLQSGNSDGSGLADDSTDVRVPVARNSLVEIVNGGVRLPTGVEQQLFVVKN